MKKLFVVIALALAWPIKPAYAASTNLDPNQCSAVSVGLNTGSPTQIFAQDPAATRTWVINTSTNTVYFVGGSTTSFQGLATNASFSISLTTGSFYLPGVAANVQPIVWELDGPGNAYTGPLWGVTVGQGLAAPVLRCRTH